MEEKNYFQSEVHYELSMHKEFTKLNTLAYGRNILLRSFSVVCLAYLLSSFNSRYTIILFLLLSAFYLIMFLVPYFKNKDGGLAYKQALHRNDGEPPHHLTSLAEDGIRSRNMKTDNVTFDSYDQIRFIMESKNLLVLVTELKMCHIIDKRTLAGGSREELVAFLQEHCPKLKKRIKTETLGRVVNCLMWILVASGIVMGAAILLEIPEKLTGRLHNDMTYQEMADDLATLGIYISDQTISELEEYDSDYAAEYGTEYYRDNYSASKVYDLLYWEGAGVYDEETWEWTPSTSGLYWFDTEVWNIDTIYTDFLIGLSSMHDDLNFTNVQEDYSAVDMDAGTGTVAVSFDLNGEHYTLEAEYYYDWFDTDVLFEVGRILAADESEKDLWFTQDGGQGLLLYYGTKEQVNLLERKTGISFSDTVTMWIGH